MHTETSGTLSLLAREAALALGKFADALDARAGAPPPLSPATAAPPPAASAATARFGRHKNAPLRDLPTPDLQWYISQLVTSLANPEKARWEIRQRGLPCCRSPGALEAAVTPELLAEVVDACDGLGNDEARVVIAVAKRLSLGRRCYGPLRIFEDPRDWRKEASEEALDCAVYLAADLLRSTP